MSTNQFDNQWNGLVAAHEHGSFDYAASSDQFVKAVSAHFRSVTRRPRFGVYVVRQKTSNDVLYVGKSGSIDRRGQFKSQDIPARLKNVKPNGAPANAWFGSLVEEKGPLSVHYVLLERTPVSPALAEAILLQAYLDENGCLPYRNDCL